MAAVKKTSRRSTLSAGILAYRKGGARGLEVLLVHPGGPFWREKDDGAWSIPKGEIDGIVFLLLKILHGTMLKKTKTAF